MKAYEGVDDLASFTKEELEGYRKVLLRKSQPQVDFIKRHTKPNLDVFEACCGNGRLLVGLKDYVRTALGVDSAPSRVVFAQQWMLDIDEELDIQFECEDILSSTEDYFHTAICITGAPNYFSLPKVSELLKVLYKSVKHERGMVILEYYQVPSDRYALLSCSDWQLKTWYELPPEDKWRYYLEDFWYDPQRHIMSHTKTFIGRNGQIDAGREETLYYYTELEVRLMLSLAGFKKVEVFGSWNDEPYEEDMADKMVVIAYV